MIVKEIKLYDEVCRRLQREKQKEDDKIIQFWVIGDGFTYNTDHLCVYVKEEKEEDGETAKNLLISVSEWAANCGKRRYFGRFFGERKRAEEMVKQLLDGKGISYTCKWFYYSYTPSGW